MKGKNCKAMTPAKVYFTDLRAEPGSSLLQKLERLIRTAGIGDIDFKRKMTAIKLHFGEPGNLSFLRPNYAKVVAHLEAAYENGFSPFSTGCHVIIGDGLKGTDDVEVPVEGGTYVKNAKIGRAIMDADVFISLTHFKGHEQAGFGGALKNIGMGCGSRAGKMEQHAAGKPVVRKKRCVGCGMCAKQCAHGAISFGEDRKASIGHDRCVGCGRCIGVCNFDAIFNPDDCASDELNRKIAEYSKAVLDGRPHFHISLVIDVSPFCDCHGENDIPILPDVGMFASFDPVALDQACADACMAQPPMPGSRLDEAMRAPGFCDHHDHFRNTFPETNWKVCLEHAEKLGIGTRAYELITVR